MNESVEVRVARLEENMKFLVEEAKAAKEARKDQYSTNQSVGNSLQTMGNALEAVKTKLDGQTPTIEEFITIKHKVVGAGKLGKWTWITFGGLITFVFSSRETIIQWLTK